MDETTNLVHKMKNLRKLGGGSGNNTNGPVKRTSTSGNTTAPRKSLPLDDLMSRFTSSSSPNQNPPSNDDWVSELSSSVNVSGGLPMSYQNTGVTTNLTSMNTTTRGTMPVMPSSTSSSKENPGGIAVVVPSSVLPTSSGAKPNNEIFPDFLSTVKDTSVKDPKDQQPPQRTVLSPLGTEHDPDQSTIVSIDPDQIDDEFDLSSNATFDKLAFSNGPLKKVVSSPVSNLSPDRVVDPDANSTSGIFSPPVSTVVNSNGPVWNSYLTAEGNSSLSSGGNTGTNGTATQFQKPVLNQSTTGLTVNSSLPNHTAAKGKGKTFGSSDPASWGSNFSTSQVPNTNTQNDDLFKDVFTESKAQLKSSATSSTICDPDGGNQDLNSTASEDLMDRSKSSEIGSVSSGVLKRSSITEKSTMKDGSSLLNYNLAVANSLHQKNLNTAAMRSVNPTSNFNPPAIPNADQNLPTLNGNLGNSRAPAPGTTRSRKDDDFADLYSQSFNSLFCTSVPRVNNDDSELKFDQVRGPGMRPIRPPLGNTGGYNTGGSRADAYFFDTSSLDDSVPREGGNNQLKKPSVNNTNGSSTAGVTNVQQPPSANMASDFDSLFGPPP